MWWSTSITAIASPSESISLARSDSSPASSPPAGSSSSSSSGSETSARASATRFCTAYGSVPGRRSATPVAARPCSAPPRARSRSARSSRSERGSRAARSPSRARRKRSAPTITFSSTVSPREQPDSLERPRDPERRQAGRARIRCQRLPAPAERPRVGLDEAADDVEQRRLAGAVGADHPEHLAA